MGINIFGQEVQLFSDDNQAIAKVQVDVNLLVLPIIEIIIAILVARLIFTSLKK
jgi:hypothetical protein